MMWIAVGILAFFAAMVIYNDRRAILRKVVYPLYTYRARRHLKYIQRYEFPAGLRQKFHAEYPALSDDQLEGVFAALRQYFFICAQVPGKMVSMPSRIVDDAWHNFILFTRDYDEFCRHAFKNFFHHTPAEAMSGAVELNDDIRLAWALACKYEGINTRHPKSLPKLFAIDRELRMKDGFYYLLNADDELDAEELEAQPNRYYASEIQYLHIMGAGILAAELGGMQGIAGYGIIDGIAGGAGDAGFSDGGFGDGGGGAGCGGGGCGGGA